jgi:transposase-like protein
MDLYFKGVSLRKIKDHLHQFYGREIHHETIRRWIARFTRKMNEYVAQFKPKTSGTWHADEQFVDARNRKHAYGVAFTWNVMDSKTRFLIASKVTAIRSRVEAKGIFKEAESNAGKIPEKVITDSLHAYGYGIKHGFSRHVEHEKYKDFQSKTQNNKIERFHGTFRERDKVMRGMKSVEKAENYVEAFRTYYNFIRPHEGLNGLTPAQAGGINLELGRNRWLTLINQSFKI